LMRDVLNSPWGRLFRDWERASVSATAEGYPLISGDGAEIHKTGFSAFVRSLGVLGTCLKEAPEFAARRRASAARGSGR
jgi:hypothetical protein